MAVDSLARVHLLYHLQRYRTRQAGERGEGREVIEEKRAISITRKKSFKLYISTKVTDRGGEGRLRARLCPLDPVDGVANQLMHIVLG